MQLDDEIVPVSPGKCIVIPPGVKHRAIGQMKVLIMVLPKFDPQDRWFCLTLFDCFQQAPAGLGDLCHRPVERLLIRA